MSLQLIESFESNLNDALYSAVTGAKDVKEAFGDMADAMLDEITKMAIQATTRQIMGSIGGSPFGDAAGIQGAASGGLVTGGSGYKDDVPMMLQGGEFVVRKNSVDRFGSGLFKALNGYSSGGAVKPDPQSGLSSTMSIGGGGAGFSMRNAFVYDEDQNPTKGTLEVDSRLSRRSLMDSSNPRNQFRTGKEKTLQDYFTQKKQDTEQYNEEYQAYLDAKAARWNQAGITAAMMLGLNLSSGKDLGGLSGTAANMASGAQSAGKWMGFADGGSTKDDIPAMLMGGEYVMNRQAVEKYGMSTFDKLNKGQMPSFAEGGPVGNPQAINGQSGGAGSLTNNVNITVNLDNNGSVSSDIKSSATNENAAGSQRQQSKELARTIESAVLKVLVNEKRQGGMLN
jgi:hypothetical protein